MVWVWEKREEEQQRVRLSHYDMIKMLLNEPWQQCSKLNVDLERLQIRDTVLKPG